MKCLKFVIVVLFMAFLCHEAFADFLSADNIETYISSNSSGFFQQADWITVDAYIGYSGGGELTYDTPDSQDFISLQQPFFNVFNYIPDTDTSLISAESLKDFVFIKSENNLKISLQYRDSFNNPVSDGYPKLFYRTQNSSSPWTEVACSSSDGSLFNATLSENYGIYEYYVIADNENYPDEYISGIKTFIVTERPHSFKNLNPNLQDDNGNANAALNFKWSAQKGVDSDTLTYKLYLGTSESSLQQYDLGTQTSYTAQNLQPRTKYYWKVEVQNQYGAEISSPLFSFITLGEIRKAYNAPNPFNPQKGQSTRIFFEMAHDGSADIDVYSEYGDKIFHKSLENLNAGNNEFTYDGKDDYGNILYNGTYLCAVKKKYSGRTSTERCRLLIIK